MTAIREAGREDVAHLAALHASSFDRPWTAEAFADLLGACGALALCAGEDGFVLVRRVLDEAEVLTLAVRPDARRRGLARALVEAAAARLASAGVTELRLEAAVDNAAALALYAASGFEPTGRRRAYYARGAGRPSADAVTLLRRLNRPAV